MEKGVAHIISLVIFVQDAEFFASWILCNGQVKMCESCVSAVKIFPELGPHPTNNSKVILTSINLATSLMSSMSASDRMTVFFTSPQLSVQQCVLHSRLFPP